jgi:hypothetical protein
VILASAPAIAGFAVFFVLLAVLVVAVIRFARKIGRR